MQINLPKRMLSATAKKAVTMPRSQKTQRKRAKNSALQAGQQKILSVSAPVSKSHQLSRGPPLVERQSDGSIKITHTEYLLDVPGATTGVFQTLQIPINPGIYTSFPFLSGLALSYESYQFDRLSFRFETEAATSTSGSVFHAVDYDAADAAPVNKNQLMSMTRYVRCPPWNSSKFTLDQKSEKALGQQRYVRVGALASNLDIKTYDVGNYFLGTQGVSVTTVGEVHVDYVCRLFSPQNNIAQRILANSLKVVSTGSVSRTAVFGTAPVSSGALAIQVGNDVGNSCGFVYFPFPGTFLVELDIVGTAIVGDPVWTAYDNTSPGITMTTLVATAFPTAATTGTWIGVANVTAVAPLPTSSLPINTTSGAIQLSWNAHTTTLTGQNMRITPYTASLA